MAEHLPIPKNARPVESTWGAPLEPVGNPLTAGIGPGSWNEQRADRPDMTVRNLPKIVPMRVAPEFSVAHEDPDPRGMTVKGMDGVVAGKVVDLWCDRSEPQLRYLEIELAGGGRRLLPVPFVRVPRPATHVQVHVLKGADFPGIPQTRQADLITLREEDQISAYFGAGSLYNSDLRYGPLM
jgi:photosynthetic reaction center H subunit